MTLSPVVALKAEIGSDDDKDHLAAALFYLGIPSTGSVNEDIFRLSAEIDKYVPVFDYCSLDVQLRLDRLVTILGLKSNLKTYNVPVADLPEIAGRALGSQDGPEFAKVVKLLEGLYV